MDGWLKQNTAATVKVGPYISSTDGFTLCVSTGGVTLGSTDVRLSKAGGDFASKASATTSVYDENGIFDVSLSTGDVGTVGRLKLYGATTAAYLPVWHDYMVLPANVYDSLVAGSDYLDVNAVQVSSGDSTTNILASLVDDATRIDASALNTLVGKVPSKAYLTGTTNSDGDVAMDQATGDFPGSVGSVAGAVGSVSAQVTLTTGTHDTIVDKTWDELLSAHTSTGSMGDAVNRIDEMSTGLTTIEAKLPSKSYLTGSSNADGDIDASQFIGNFAGSVGSVTGGVTVTTNNDKSGYALSPTTGLGAQTANITGNLSGSVGSVTGGVTVTTNNDKSGYALSPTTGLGAQTANITGNLSGSVGSVTGGVTITTNNDKSGYALSPTTGLGAQTANITGNISGSVGSVTAGVTLTTGARDLVADAVLDETYESTESVRDYLRVSRSVLYGKSSGGGTATATFRDRADGKARVTATVSTDGDRSAVTVDATT